MKLTIKLIDPEYCDDRCPELRLKVTDGMVLYNCRKGYFRSSLTKYKNLIRPPKCIRENGR